MAQADDTELRVVLVDDDALVLAVNKRVLGRLGYTVATFDDVQRALNEVAETRPFAVIADLQMPEMDGVTLLRRVRELSPTSFRVLFTGEVLPSELERVQVAGLTHEVVAKSDGNRLLPEALARFRATAGR